MSRFILPSLVLLAACGEEIPEHPTWFADVQPIVVANCARCHGADPVEPKVANFRLDRYVKGDDVTFDAYDYAIAAGGDRAPMIASAVDQVAPAMPPDYALSDRQREILERWSEQGALKGERANALPEIELIAPLEAPTVDQSIEIIVRARDADRDGLAVQLWAHDRAAATDDDDVPLGPVVGAGLRTIAADTGLLASKHVFEIYAIVDDGFDDDPAKNRHRTPLIASLTVDHGARGTAPRVALVAPNGGETLIGSSNIMWSASDPDPGDGVVIDLDLMRVAPDGTEVVAGSIAQNLSASPYAWMIASSIPDTENGTPIAYKVRVTATDMLGVPPNARTDESDATFTIARPMTTTLGWTDVEPTFRTYCQKCHDDPAKTAAINYFCLLKYSASPDDQVAGCAASDQGVFEVRSKVYSRMVELKNMPPAAEPNPPQADLDRIANWILGGAPKGGGGGPMNMLPTFTWSSPAATQSSGATVTLTWSAADAEGLASGKLEYSRRNGLPSSGCAGTGTYTPITDPAASATLAGATTWMGSFSWAIPNPTAPGYYCVRGSVTDTNGATTTTVNSYGVK